MMRFKLVQTFLLCGTLYWQKS